MNIESECRQLTLVSFASNLSSLSIEIWLITLTVNFDYVGFPTLTFLVEYLD